MVTMREVVLVLGLAVAVAAIVVGVAMLSTPAAWIVGGLLGGALVVAVTAEV